MTGGLIGNTALLGVLAVTAYQDWREQKIGIYLPCAAGIVGLLLYLFYREHTLTDLLLGMGIGVVMLLIAWTGRECIGAGDGVMLVASGTFLGFWGNLRLLIAALFLAAVAALFLLVIKRKGRNYRMPFLPFLLVAYLFQLG
ncbi:MAG: prepilin peptidase [Roseburia sp.]|nr:prepilin peptidase [Roseburia sp.]